MTPRSANTASREEEGEPTATVAPGSVHAITAMIKDLEVQLDRMIAINGALEQDLEGERAKRLDLKRSHDDVVEKLRQAEWEAASKEDLIAETIHLKAERARLANAVNELKEQLKNSERERVKASSAVERMRTGRSDALEEVQCVEAQFERAMEVVADHKTRLAVMTEEYEALRGRLKVAYDSLSQAERERDSLLAEVEESRVALEDIRRSLVDACVLSQYPKPDGDQEGSDSQ